MVELGRETDVKKRRAIVERVQAIFYEDVGRIKFGEPSPSTSPGKSCAATSGPCPTSISGTRGSPDDPFPVQWPV